MYEFTRTPRRPFTEDEVLMVAALEGVAARLGAGDARFVADLAREMREGKAGITSGQGVKLRAMVRAAWKRCLLSGRIAVLAETVP